MSTRGGAVPDAPGNALQDRSQVCQRFHRFDSLRCMSTRRGAVPDAPGNALQDRCKAKKIESRVKIPIRNSRGTACPLAIAGAM
jgi:hypothetical protein